MIQHTTKCQCSRCRPTPTYVGTPPKTTIISGGRTHVLVGIFWDGHQWMAEYTFNNHRIWVILGD